MKKDSRHTAPVDDIRDRGQPCSSSHQDRWSALGQTCPLSISGTPGGRALRRRSRRPPPTSLLPAPSPPRPAVAQKGGGPPPAPRRAGGRAPRARRSCAARPRAAGQWPPAAAPRRGCSTCAVNAPDSEGERRRSRAVEKEHRASTTGYGCSEYHPVQLNTCLLKCFHGMLVFRIYAAPTVRLLCAAPLGRTRRPKLRLVRAAAAVSTAGCRRAHPSSSTAEPRWAAARPGGTCLACPPAPAVIRRASSPSSEGWRAARRASRTRPRGGVARAPPLLRWSGTRRAAILS